MEGNPIDAYLKDYLQHLIWVGLSLVCWMLIKDFLAKLAAGISFAAIFRAALFVVPTLPAVVVALLVAVYFLIRWYRSKS